MNELFTFEPKISQRAECDLVTFPMQVSADNLVFPLLLAQTLAQKSKPFYCHI